MADKPKKYIYVEPDDYIPKEIYDKYFGDDSEAESEKDVSEEAKDLLLYRIHYIKCVII